MPNCLSINPHIILKGLKLAALLLLFPLSFFGQQQTLTGLWVGALSNDSNTIRKDQSFEIALTEYKGKVYGYSRSEFIVNDTLYYIVKRVKGTIKGDVCEVMDDEIISYNFPGRRDKGVKVVSTFYRDKKDSTWYLAGKWTTTQTKRYYAITGRVDLQEEKDLAASKLFPHLEELNLANDVAFYKERKPAPVVMRTAEPESKKLQTLIKAERQTTLDATVAATTPELKTEIKTGSIPVIPISQTGTEASPSETDSRITTAVEDEKQPATIKPREQPDTKSSINASVKSDINVIPEKRPVVSQAAINNSNLAAVKKPETIPPARTDDVIAKTNTSTEKKEPMPENKPAPVINKPVPPKTEVVKTTAPINQPTNNTSTIKRNEPVKTDPVVAKNNPPAEKKNNSLPVSNTNLPEIKQAPPKTLEQIIAPAATIAGRKSEFAETVSFKSDSLELALYDNGEIDGDTVSVFFNGQVLMSKQGLKAAAIKKTIYITPGKDDEFTLVLYAENLGRYPPNTGLLVVHDGEDVYNIRFSADYQKNAGVVFKRKR